jgi:lysophospholipid acyltransferase (LPLAT)-like uncharacterized protein
MKLEGLKIGFSAVAGALLVALLGRTLRVRSVGAPDSHGRVIYAFWHGRMLVPLFTHRRRRICILISQHADGEIVSRVAKILGYEPVRGSTTRGGVRGLLAMLRKANRGRSLAVTPDGPRGPRYVFQPGAIKLAQLTGFPILPVGIGVDRKIVLSSWDRFFIPHPFTRCVYVFGQPIGVGRDDDPARAAALAQEKLEELTRVADSYFARA